MIKHFKSFREKKASLALRLITIIILIYISTILTFSWFVIKSVENHFIEQEVFKMKTVSQTIQQEFSSHLIVTEYDIYQLLAKSQNNRNIEDKLNSIVVNFPNISFSINEISGNSSKAIYTNNSELISRLPDIEPKSVFSTDVIKVLLPTSMMEEMNINSNSLEDETNYLKMNNGNIECTYRVSKVSFMINEKKINKDYQLTIALDINAQQHYLKKLHNSVWMSLFIIAIIVILLIPFFIYQGLAPLRKTSNQIKNINSNKLNTRLDPNSVPIELTELIVSFNSMIEQIEDVFNKQANFSADIAHELRTPITNLITQNQIIISRNRSNDEYKETLFSNLEEYERMSKMVNDMLFLAQAEHQQLALDIKPLNLKNELQILTDYFEDWAEERLVSMQITGEDSYIQGDRLMIQRVFSNLLTNAITYTPPHHNVIIELEVGPNILIKDKPAVAIRVNNQVRSGEEISPEHLPRLFDRFYRADKSRQRSEDKNSGTGIGLAIVKSIVEFHEGSIFVESKNQLTTFTVLIPIME